MTLIGLLTYLLFISIINVNCYDPQTALTSVWLSGAAYCGKDMYYNMNLGGPSQGFKTHIALYDYKSDLQGYTGVLIDKKQIYAVFRPFKFINWLDSKQVLYNSIECLDCKVHNGFYKSSLAVKDDVLLSIRGLKKKYPNYEIIVTGHSYGAACAQLIGMELVANGFQDVSIYNFGQPRVGNKIFANYVETKLADKLWRFTHNKDVVPHLPTNDYLHSSREIFETEDGYLRLCSDYVGEDPKCADQYALKETNTADHLIYLRHNMTCEASIISKIQRSILERLLT
jgi:hypothetical protein